MLPLLVQVTFRRVFALREVLLDQLFGEAWEGGEEAGVDGVEESRRDGGPEGGVVELGQVLFRCFR